MSLRDLCHQILGQKIIQKAAASRNITVNPEDIQNEAEKTRREKRLEKVSDTLAWLQMNMLTPDEWEIALKNRLLADKLLHDLFDKQVESYFASNRLDFEQYVIYQIVVPYQKLAQELFYQIEEEEISFYEAAHLYDIDQERRDRCGYLGKMYRRNFQPEVAAAILRDPLPIRQVVGPIQTEQGFNLFKIEEYIQAELTPEIFQELVLRFFQQWLDNEINYVIHSQDKRISVTPEN
ncbi:parvulin-like peptidyl-prolyl isomerase [Xenococcus sp. PCC 7305]|uniref:peptidylprolyl isomerase n=1 Tax=Xenococcus sp. PCC 7305 TaxID=102125 RepID=UPI0002ABAA42|nr:peptidylprolyl isomerase [Xenococcus sp. PCC 7305]ELS03809.1 parvulin-like peptidyl-prolyl isomerase [Xenococcus sp. PCC 7305]